MPANTHGRLSTLWLVVVASIVGGVTGLVSETFAELVTGVGRFRTWLVGWAHTIPLVGLIVVVSAAALATGIAAWLVHRVEPHAEGSGIPRVEAVVEGRAEPGRFRILPIKYVGGLLVIGSGLALGREGPSVQMGGVIGATTARWARLSASDMRMVVAGGAAAGLATAFNAPIAGGVFVLEELFKRFDPRATVSTLSASAAGFAATHLLAGDRTVFSMPNLPAPALWQAPLCLAVGVLSAGLAALYNRAIMSGLRWSDSSRIPGPRRAAAIGVAVGLLAFAAPQWVGGGDGLTQSALTGAGTVRTVAVLFAIRFALGVVSYAANTPGGLFAPMLVLGSHAGLWVGLISAEFIHLPAGTTAALALAGMAAFFTASVQAPVTGIVLATELTGTVTWLPPMLGTVATAMLMAMLLGIDPIYDALTTRSARNALKNKAEELPGVGPVTAPAQRYDTNMRAARREH